MSFFPRQSKPKYQKKSTTTSGEKVSLCSPAALGVRTHSKRKQGSCTSIPSPPGTPPALCSSQLCGLDCLSSPFKGGLMLLELHCLLHSLSSCQPCSDTKHCQLISNLLLWCPWNIHCGDLQSCLATCLRDPLCGISETTSLVSQLYRFSWWSLILNSLLSSYFYRKQFYPPSLVLM